MTIVVNIPPPSADEIMDMMARWVARLYGVKVTVRIDGPVPGCYSESIRDGREPARRE